MSCIICYQEKKLIRTKCNHSFCRDCIHCWSKKNRTCPVCRMELFWDVKEEFLTFLKENEHSNVPTSVFIENFIFYYRGFYNDTFSSIRYILNLINYKDKEEYNFQNIIDSIEHKYHHRYIFYIFTREIIRYHNKSFLKKMKNSIYSFLKK